MDQNVRVKRETDQAPAERVMLPPRPCLTASTSLPRLFPEPLSCLPSPPPLSLLCSPSTTLTPDQTAFCLHRIGP